MWKKFSFYLDYIENESEESENEEKENADNENSENSENKNNGIKYYTCYFRITNNQKVTYYGLKFHIYIYQSVSNGEEENFIYNNSLEDKLFVEGCLSLNINKLEPNEEFKYDINVYPLKKEEFNISCLLLDKEKKEVYFCPTIINLKL